MNIRSKLAGAEQPPFVVAFDGDDTPWVDTAAEQDWERHFEHLAIDRLPDPKMAKLFGRYLDLYGFTVEGIRQALLRAGAETCRRELPDAWHDQVMALPELASNVSLRAKPDVERMLASAKAKSTQLWLITKGDVIRQAIKIARFEYAEAFAHVEIVPKRRERHIRPSSRLAQLIQSTS